jgi:hypothetical protein
VLGTFIGEVASSIIDAAQNPESLIDEAKAGEPSLSMMYTSYDIMKRTNGGPDQ